VTILLMKKIAHAQLVDLIHVIATMPRILIAQKENLHATVKKVS